MSTEHDQPDTRFRVFAVVFGATMVILYCLAEANRWPLFTYHPGTGGFDWGWVAARKDEGPAMYWYGWIATSVMGGVIAGGLAALLPQRLAGRIPVALGWLVPVLLVPVMIYSLRFFWRW